MFVGRLRAVESVCDDSIAYSEILDRLSAPGLPSNCLESMEESRW